MSEKLLIVEDDKKLNDGIRLALKNDAYFFYQCRTLQEAREILKKEDITLVLLDVNLPDGNGIDFVREIRKNSQVPIILLTVNNMEVDIVTGLEAGANDYITKPFSLMVLRARVSVQLRNKEAAAKNSMELDGFEFYFDKMEFFKDGEPIELSKTEQKLLRVLCENRGKVLKREYLIDEVWQGDTEFVDAHALTVAVKRLRDKLEDDTQKPEYVKTVYVIVDYSDKYTEQPVSYYQSGETFKMEYGNGKQKDYGVIGEAMMPYSLDYPYADSVYITVMVPEEEYITQTENQSAMYAAIDAKKGEDKQVKEYIDKNVLKENDMINVFSVLDMKESFQQFVSKYYMIGSFLVVILAFIGIMNFFNTTATSVISRKKELALLEVVGMTKKQISKMLVAEGFLYLGGAFMIAVLLVVVGAKQILINTLGTAFFFRLHLTIVPCVLMIPILVGIAYVIPKYQFEKMSQESVVERIRKE